MRGLPWRFVFGVLILACLAGPIAPVFAARPKPNVIIILADDLGYADVGFNGCKDVPTPHIDSLARDGVRFTNGYVSHPFCSPTRAGLLTGRYQQRFGHENNVGWEPENNKLGLPLDQVTLADVMKKGGYVTGVVGKWHLGAAPCFHPGKRGFEEFFGFLHGSHPYFNGLRGDQENFNPLMRNQTKLDEKDYLTDAFSREAVEFVQRHKSEPFFLYLAYNAVHTPLQAPKKYLDRFETIKDERRRTYAAMDSAMDDGIGLLLRKLRELKLEEDTLVFFLSDNGGPPPAASPASNAPLRGHKGTVFEGGIRVPFLARWKGRLKAGTTCDEPIISIDLFPTAAAAGGAHLPESLELDGVDILPYLTGRTRTPPHERLFWRMNGGTDWAVREGKWKLTQTMEGKRSLFDLSADLAEQNDLALAQPEVVERLAKDYAEWNKPNIPPRWENPRPRK